MSKGRRSRRAAPVVASSLGRGDVAASLVLVFPLLLAYQLAILVTPAVAATDPVSRALYSLCGGRAGYLLAQALIAGGFLYWLHASGRARLLALAVVAPVALESLLLALLLWLGLPILVQQVFGLGVGTSFISAIGAGVYEELVFRGLLLAGIVRVARAAGASARLVPVLAISLAALAFAAAHHVGAMGDAWTLRAFAFRALAGLALGAALWLRSLAHAVYAHVLYDVLVLLG